MKALIDQLENNRTLSFEEWITLIDGRTPEVTAYLLAKARKTRDRIYGKAVYIRGLIEFTSFCRNNCLYCGLRRDHKTLRRYRLTMEEILSCCEVGYQSGFRTFVLQGGEDPFFTDERLTAVIKAVRTQFPDCAITLSAGERTEKAYQRFYDAGADRYLLRHETADSDHYAAIHPKTQTLDHRIRCLKQLKSIGYEVGTGFMVGSPGQRAEHLARDMMFIRKLNPQMVGIGPFIPHHETPFRYEKAGSLELTLFMLGLLRLMLPGILLPATTALGSLTPEGRLLGIQAGANVIMPSLTPQQHRKDYALYDGKLSSGAETAEGLQLLREQLQSIGHHLVIDRGDSKNPSGFNASESEAF